jgi:hypothetical protein
MNQRLIAVLTPVVLSLIAAAPLRAQSTSPAKPAPQPAPHAIQVLKIVSSEIKLPPAFQMAIYEHALEEIKKTGLFQEIYRDGDRRASGATDLVTLRTDVRGFKKGSAMERQVLTVAGTTEIKVHMEVAKSDGTVIAQKEVEGKVHFFGENMRATFNLSKSMAKALKESFQKPAASGRS